jgi:hypothetical protein
MTCSPVSDNVSGDGFRRTTQFSRLEECKPRGTFQNSSCNQPPLDYISKVSFLTRGG